MKYGLVIFDCDGTLVNTVVDVAECFSMALQDNGYASCCVDDVARLVGKPLEFIVRELIALASGISSGQVGECEIASVAQAYREIYAVHPKPNTAPFPGMRQLVYDLIDAGTVVAVNSNKPEGPLRALLRDCFPGRKLQVVGHTASRPAKPDPAGALELCDNTGISPESALYVGDTEIDFLTAHRAGVNCSIVSWGQGDDKFLTTLEPGVRCDTVVELRARVLM